jgi:hypothetical protein
LSDTYAAKTTQVVVAAEANSVAEFPVLPIGTDNYYESVVGVFSPFGAAPWSSMQGALGAVGYWTSGGVVASADNLLGIVFRASKNSSIFVEPNTVAVVSAFDGGSGETDSNSAPNFYVVEYASRMGQFPKGNWNNTSGGSPPSNSIATTQFSHMNSSGGTPTQKIMSRSGGFKYTLPTSSQYYRWWTPTGLQPTVNRGRTAGVWSTTGEAVRKHGWIIPTPFTWTAASSTSTATQYLLTPVTVCPFFVAGTNPGVLGISYNNFVPLVSTQNTLTGVDSTVATSQNIHHSNTNSQYYSNQKS